MRRTTLIGGTVAVILVIVVAALVWNDSCESPYDISVEIRPSRAAGFPYVAKGAIRGCGMYALSGRSDFQLMLSPSRSSISRSRHGKAIVQVMAGISAEDKRKAWYVVTVERNSVVVASKREVVVFRP